MNQFRSWRSYSNFERSTKCQNRYFWNAEVNEFLDAIVATSKDRERTIAEGKIFWRSQLGHDYRPIYQDEEHIADEPCPYPQARMKPIFGQASEGRVNPKGIPYLYLATHRDTALSEVRPWIGSLVSVAQFKILRELVVIDCSVNTRISRIYLKEPEPQEREIAVWSDIDRDFSKPINPSDQLADYIPTQIIAELFKIKGFDGVAYKSVFGAGYNLALFEIDAAELINCSLCEAKDIKFDFREASNPYFSKKHYEPRVETGNGVKS